MDRVDYARAGLTEGSVVPAGRVPATAADEIPTYIPADAEHVFGIVTTPTVAFNGIGVLLLHAGAQNLSSHKGGTWTRLCRNIAADGYLTLRMDYHGSGDSSGLLEDRSVGGQTNVDVDAGVRWLQAQGASRIVIATTCWGGLVGLMAAARHESVVSACLISPPLRLIQNGARADTKGSAPTSPLTGTVRGLFQVRVLKWAATNAAYRRWLIGRGRYRLSKVVKKVRVKTVGKSAPPTAKVQRTDPTALLAPLLRRKVPIHILVGENEPTYRDLSKGLLPMLDLATPIMDITSTPVAVHGLATIESQDLVVETIQRWLAADFPSHGKVS